MTMKMIYLANTRFPSEKAQSSQVMAMCEAFARHGIEVLLLAPDRKPVSADDPFAYYARERTFSFQRVPCWDLIRYAWLGRIGLWVQTLTFLWNVRRFIKKLDPDVLYSREPYVYLFSTGRAKRYWESHASFRLWWLKRLARHLDGVVTLTQASRKMFEGLGVATKRILVEPDAVDPRLFAVQPTHEEARQRLNIPTNEFVCTYVGKFTTMGQPKGVDEALEAVMRLRKRGQAVSFLAVGATVEECRRYTSCEVDGMRTVGHVSQTELALYYAAADVLLMPFPWTEHYAFFMSPLKLFEYLMSGCPIIASDLPSVREVVSEHEVFFVPAARLEDPIAREATIEALERQIEYIAQHPMETQVKVVAAQQLSERYTWQARAGRIVEFFSA